jgi:hypothetical protein
MQVSVGSAGSPTDHENPCSGAGPYEDILFKIENNNASTPVNVTGITIVGYFNSNDGLGGWGGDEYRTMIYNSAGTLQAPTAGITGTAATSTSGSYYLITFGFSTSATIPPGGYMLAGTAATNPFWQLVNKTTGAVVFDTACSNYSGLETGAGGSDSSSGTYYTAGTYYSNPHWMLYESGKPVCQYTSSGAPDPNSGIPPTGASCTCPGVTPSPTFSPSPVVTATNTYTPVPYGAALPYTEYEAENGSYTGTLIGTESNQSTWLQTWSGATISNSVNVELAAEASGREAVQLSATNQYVQWTTTAACNAIVVRYSVPYNTGNCTLSCVVSGGANFTQELPMTSAFEWFDGGWPTGSPILGYTHGNGGGAFHLYDEMHTFFGTYSSPTNIPAGSTIKLQKMSTDTAASYTIDFIDLENVGAQISMPSGYTSITSYGAVGDGTTECSADIQNCINAVTKVWIPAGNFYCNKGSNFIVPANVTIAGAGMWYSTISNGTAQNNSDGYYLGFNVGTSGDIFSNFCVQGGCTNRNDNLANSGFYYECGTGSSLTNVWVEHEKAGYWVGQNAAGNSAAASGLLITGCRFRDTYADGVNLNDGAVNCTVTQSSFRYNGDDAVALWSVNSNGYAEQSGDSVTNNTIQLPWRADGIAIYGGGPYNVQDNYVADTLDAAGILVENAFTPIYGFTGTTTIQGNELNRCGGEWDGGISGAMEFWGEDGTLGAFTLTNNTVENSTYMGFLFNGSCGSLGTFTGQQILNSFSYGIQVYTGATGSVTFNTSTISGSVAGPLLNSTALTITQNSDTGF